MWNLYDQDPLLCIAHSREWTAFSMTKRALQVLGLFDENIYPAYWEDDDMHIRLNHAVKANICSPVRYLTSATLQHNNNDDYVR
jgi:GT2 family glycosyltransferase